MSAPDDGLPPLPEPDVRGTYYPRGLPEPLLGHSDAQVRSYAQAAVASWRERAERAEQDQKRYLWLRDVASLWEARLIINDTSEGIDAAIDRAIANAARAQEGSTKPGSAYDLSDKGFVAINKAREEGKL